MLTLTLRCSVCPATTGLKAPYTLMDSVPMLQQHVERGCLMMLPAEQINI
jgi:hypothetical protein